MGNVSNQFYYVDNGKPILKTEYDDGSEDFYDASGQFNGYSWSGVGDGTVIDPYGDMAQQEADKQAGKANREAAASSGSQGYADPSQGRSSQMSNPLKPRQQQQNVDDPSSHSVQSNQASSYSPPPPPSGGAANQDPNQEWMKARYDWAGDPKSAMLNAMADLAKSGGRKFELAANPFVDRLLAAAPGLATSYMAQRGLQGGGQDSVPGSYGGYKDFLTSALQGGNVYNTLQGAQGMFPQVVDQVRQYKAATSTGGDPQSSIAQNPFLAQLAEAFSQGGNRGALLQYGNLFTPMMTGAMQNPFADQMQSRFVNAGSNAVEHGVDPYNQGSGGNDFFKYLFGY